MIADNWIFGRYLCILSALIDNTCLVTSMYLIMMISIERYLKDLSRGFPILEGPPIFLNSGVPQGLMTISKPRFYRTLKKNKINSNNKNYLKLNALGPRYIRITNPRLYRKRITPRVTKCMVSMCWFCSVGLSAPPVFGVATYE